MSSSTRNILSVFLIVVMALVSFGAGYVVNDLVQEIQHPGTVTAASDEDMFLFWEVWQYVGDHFIGELPNGKERAYGAIRGSLNLLGDPYTIFIEPQVREQEKESLRGNFGGIGATLTRNEAGEVVLSPIAGNPAANAGILEGDRLLAIDGIPIPADMTVEQIAEKIRGEKGTFVTLTILHPNQTEAQDIRIERADILIPSVSFRLLEQDPTIGYIQLTRFSGESSNELRQALLTLQEQGATHLIFDLRQNGGGLLDAAVQIADHFLTNGIILEQNSRTEGEKQYEADSETLVADLPVVILIDGGTASASEIVAGALRDLDRATLIGSRSYGKGSVQLIYDLSDGSSIHITSARWFTPSGQQLDGQGLQPDIPVEITQEAIDKGQDEVLERAVLFLQTGQ